jgi:hypothetical protein
LVEHLELVPIGANDLWIAAQAQALINWLR